MPKLAVMPLKNSFAILFISFLFACNGDKKQASNNQAESLNEINIRLDRDPRYIHPVFYASSLGRQIFQYIYLSAGDFHPETYELTPILITEIPKGYVSVVEGEEWINYDFEFKKDARWSDGTSITNRDYAFTLKMANHPLSEATGWRTFFSTMKEIKLDPSDSRKFTVSFDNKYMLSLEGAVTVNLMPAHIYDPKNVISSLDIRTILNDGYEEQDSAIMKQMKSINKAVNETTGVVQCGPYSLTAYESNQYIILERNENYWGKAYPENPFLQAHPSKMTFKIVPDEMTAVTMAKENQLDLIVMRNGDAFLELKNDLNLNEDWTFHVPQQMTYYYIALNNKSPILSDTKVRNALAHLNDVDDYIENNDGGLGIRTTGPFHPTKSYYNNKLSPIPYDLEKANKLLDEAGWDKTDNDNIRYKIIEGKKERLSLDVIMSGRKLGKNVALLFQEAALKAGVELNLITKKTSLMRTENLNIYNYDMALSAVTPDLNPDDPHRRWHSSNADNGANNFSGYSNPEADKLIDAIRSTRDIEERKVLFYQLQEIMYADQPAIFLWSPLSKILINKKFEATTTGKRPGYLANTFKLAS